MMIKFYRLIQEKHFCDENYLCNKNNFYLHE